MPTLQPKQVLIVDDEPNVAKMIAASLEVLGEGYILEVAHSGKEALAKLQNNPCAVVITDYNMPGMNGLDLAQMVREISPATQIVLMSAYGTEDLQEVVGNLNLDGYIDKPFDVHEIRAIVKRAVEQIDGTKPEAGLYQASDQLLNDAVSEHLKSLQGNTGARCVLLISSGGYPVNVVGVTQHLDISGVSTLVAANFLASVELAGLLGSNKSVFKSSYYEGNDYNVYAYDINGDFLLAIIFGAESKPGVVWFYTKQTAGKLSPLITNFSTKFRFSEDDLNTALDAGFEGLFDEAEKTADVMNPVESKNDDSGSTPFVDKKSTTASPPVRREREKSKPLTFDQAVAAGLVPPKLVNRERDR